MSQERLNGFAMCNIEKAILDISDLNTDDFALRNARRSIFLWANGYYGAQIYGNQINSRNTNKLLF